MTDLLPVEEAQQRLLALGETVEAETLPIARTAGRWLAETVRARRNQPAADLSAMDGYAVRFDEMPGPWRLAGESAAGAPFDRPLAAGEAARIYTGARVPDGADTVIVQEEVRREGEQLTLDGEGPAAMGRNIRRQGEDFRSGDVLLKEGVRLTPAALALAIAGGHGDLYVRRRIRIALISTGDELVPPGVPTDPEQLPASNGPMLAAQLARLPVAADDFGIVGDTLGAIGKAIDAARKADIIVTIGGASVGDRDLVRPALDAAGAKLDFWRIAMKPGKPLLAGRLGDAVVLGLPGNPASALVTARLFLEPLIAHLSGAADPMPVASDALLGADLPAGGPRHEYLRGRWSADGVIPLSAQSSAALAALAEADLLISRPPGCPPAGKGGQVPVILL